MIRVLHVIGAMDRAGAETMIMNYYRAIDRDQIQFDFLVHTDRHCDFDDEIEALGGNIYHMPRFVGANYLHYKNACRRFFEAHPEIDIVHGHIESCASIYLPEAERSGKVTICHCHQANGPLSPIEIAFRLATFRNKHSANFYMACSKKAGRDRFGLPVVESGRFSVLNNAIDLSAFRRAKEQRAEVREMLQLQGKPVFGHVGRFTGAKNHPFLIEIFQTIAEKLPDAQLLLVGRGETEEAIQHLVKEKGLSGSVHFLGVRDDIPQMMAAMDVFLFPSVQEGLGIVAIEAQASGLPCLVSAALPDEAVLLPSAKRLPIDDAALWADEALACLQSDRTDNETIDRMLTDHGYEIKAAANSLTNLYQSMKDGNEDQ